MVEYFCKFRITDSQRAELPKQSDFSPQSIFSACWSAEPSVRTPFPFAANVHLLGGNRLPPLPLSHPTAAAVPRSSNATSASSLQAPRSFVIRDASIAAQTDIKTRLAFGLANMNFISPSSFVSTDMELSRIDASDVSAANSVATPGQALRLFLLRITLAEACRITSLELQRVCRVYPPHPASMVMDNASSAVNSLSEDSRQAQQLTIANGNRPAQPGCMQRVQGICSTTGIAGGNVSQIEPAFTTTHTWMPLDHRVIVTALRKIAESTSFVVDGPCQTESAISWRDSVHGESDNTGGAVYATARRVPFGVASAALTPADCAAAHSCGISYVIFDGPCVADKDYEWDVMHAFKKDVSGATAVALGFASRATARPDAFPGLFPLHTLCNTRPDTQNYSEQMDRSERVAHVPVNTQLTDPASNIAGKGWWCDSPITVIGMSYESDTATPRADDILLVAALAECGWASVLIAAGHTEACMKRLTDDQNRTATKLLGQWIGRLGHALICDWQSLVSADKMLVNMLVEYSGCSQLPLYDTVCDIESGHVRFCKPPGGVLTVISANPRPRQASSSSSVVSHAAASSGSVAVSTPLWSASRDVLAPKWLASPPFAMPTENVQSASADVFSSCRRWPREPEEDMPLLRTSTTALTARSNNMSRFPRENAMYYIYVANATWSACNCIVPTSQRYVESEGPQRSPMSTTDRREVDVFDACRSVMQTDLDSATIKRMLGTAVPREPSTSSDPATDDRRLDIAASSNACHAAPPTALLSTHKSGCNMYETLFSDAIYLRAGMLCPLSLSFYELAQYVSQTERDAMALACRDLYCFSYSTCPACKYEKFARTRTVSARVQRAVGIDPEVTAEAIDSEHPRQSSVPIDDFVHVQPVRHFVSIIPRRPPSDDPLGGFVLSGKLVSTIVAETRASAAAACNVSGSTSPYRSSDDRAASESSFARPEDIVAGLYTPRAIVIANACCAQTDSARSVLSSIEDTMPTIAGACDCVGSVASCAVPAVPLIRGGNVVDATSIAILFLSQGASDSGTNNTTRSQYLRTLQGIIEQSAPSLGPMQVTMAHAHGVLYPVLIAACTWLQHARVYIDKMDDSFGTEPQRDAPLRLTLPKNVVQAFKGDKTVPAINVANVQGENVGVSPVEYMHMTAKQYLGQVGATSTAIASAVAAASAAATSATTVRNAPTDSALVDSSVAKDDVQEDAAKVETPAEPVAPEILQQASVEKDADTSIETKEVCCAAGGESAKEVVQVTNVAPPGVDDKDVKTENTIPVTSEPDKRDDGEHVQCDLSERTVSDKEALIQPQLPPILTESEAPAAVPIVSDAAVVHETSMPIPSIVDSLMPRAPVKVSIYDVHTQCTKKEHTSTTDRAAILASATRETTQRPLLQRFARFYDTLVKDAATAATSVKSVVDTFTTDYASAYAEQLTGEPLTDKKELETFLPLPCTQSADTTPHHDSMALAIAEQGKQHTPSKPRVEGARQPDVQQTAEHTNAASVLDAATSQDAKPVERREAGPAMQTILQPAQVQYRIFPLNFLAAAARAVLETSEYTHTTVLSLVYMNNQLGSSASAGSSTTGGRRRSGDDVGAKMQMSVENAKLLSTVFSNTELVLQQSMCLVCASLRHWTIGTSKECARRNIASYDIEAQTWAGFFHAALIAIARAVVSVQEDETFTGLLQNCKLNMDGLLRNEVHTLSNAALETWTLNTYNRSVADAFTQNSNALK